MDDLNHPEVHELIRLALAEDIGSGDITSQACVPRNRMASGTYFAKDEMVLAGIELIPMIFAEEQVEIRKHTGERAASGEPLATVYGTARRLLERERVSLNLLQRLSGVATHARRYSDAIAGTNCRLLDTRKTTPGMRRLEKIATAAGGATNHRMGLYDAVLIKNNHIAAAGGVRQAVEAAKSEGLPIEIEVRNRAEIDEALSAGAVHLLLDNLTPAQAADEICYIARRAKVELSGGITLETVRAYAETGADFVSSGALTHSAAAVDINFRLELT
jgi:nicotinate-nucleotide pyrophosphorylase (carboxylating)